MNPLYSNTDHHREFYYLVLPYISHRHLKDRASMIPDAPTGDILVHFR